MKAHNAQALIDKGQVNFLSTASQLKQHSACSVGWWLMAGAGLF
jgi:hypothetical protein